MNYWLDLFTGTTWDEFRRAGATVTGFRESTRKRAKRVKPGDILLCYLTGVMRWVGALEVTGSTNDARPIWASDTFPVRFAVKRLVTLDPECGIEMKDFEGKLDFYRGPEHRGGFKGFLRMSPNLFRREGDGVVILDALREAERNPVARPVDRRKLARKPSYFKVEFRKGKVAIPTVISVPDQDDEATDIRRRAEFGTRHVEIRITCLSLVRSLG